MSCAIVARHLSSRLSTIQPRVRNNNLTRTFSPTLSYRSSPTLTNSPRRTFSLSAHHTQRDTSLSTSASSFAQLPFAELVARTSSFLVDYYEAPTASPIVAAQFLAALQQYTVTDTQQRQLKERLEGELDELVNEGNRRRERERRLGDERPPVDSQHEDEHHEDVLRVVHLDDDEVLEQRIIARPPSPLQVDGLHAVDGWHVDGEVDGLARGKFDSGYSTDQLLVDSLPTLKEEEAVQLGRRDMMRLMGTRE